MKRKGMWAAIMAAIACAALLTAWQTGLAAGVYRRFFPRPIAGDVQPELVKGINGLGLGKLESDGFDFIVAGHIYGRENVPDHLPDKALRAAIPAIKEMRPAFLVSLGDMIQLSQPQEFDLLDQTLLNALPFPVFNTVGNHDLGNRAAYEDRYGQTYYTFKYGPARLVF